MFPLNGHTTPDSVRMWAEYDMVYIPLRGKEDIEIIVNVVMPQRFRIGKMKIVAINLQSRTSLKTFLN